MEAETEVKTIQVHLKCPDCEINMINVKSISGLPRYKCSRCKTETITNKVYPYIKYVKC